MRSRLGHPVFTHVIVLFFFDWAPVFELDEQLLRRPRGMEHMPEVGVFA